MGQELEIKLRCRDLAAVRATLEAAGATHVADVLEINTLFDTPDGRLRSADCGLRLRQCLAVEGEATANLTYKGPRTGGPFKQREELESGVTDEPAVAGILERLGISPTVVYEKRRRSWTLKGCQVELDELPRLGTFVEIEGPDAQAIQQVRKTLELQAAEAEPATYVELAVQHGVREANGAVALRFETRPQGL
jgi:adenylate cyclase class 2